MADEFISVGSLSQDDLDLARKAGFDLSGYLPEDAVTRENWRAVTPEDTSVSAGDVGRALGAGAAGIGSSLGAATEYLTGGAYGGDTRKYFEEVAQNQVAGMSPVSRRAFQAEFLPEEGGASVLDNWTASLGLKSAAAIPSLVASIIPAGLAVRMASGLGLGARTVIGGGTARATAGAMTGGEVASQIYSSIDKLTDEELRQSPIYEGYRSMMDEKAARQMFMRDVAGAAPVVGFALSAATGGLEGQIGRRLGGEAAKGFLRGAGKGAAAEGLQESIESGGGELLAQLQLSDANLAQMNWRKILSQTIEGGVLGAVVGAPVGGVTNIGRGQVQETPDLGPDAAQQAALNNGAQPFAGGLTMSGSPFSGRAGGAGSVNLEPATTPEATDTLLAQQEQVISGRAPAMIFPVGTQELALPEGLARVERPEGVVHYDPSVMTQEQMLRMPINRMLGYVQPKADVLTQQARGVPATVVAEMTPQGQEVRAAVVSQPLAQQQANLFEQRKTPGNVVTETTPEAIQRNRGLERLAAQDEITRQGYRDLEGSSPLYPAVTPGQARTGRTPLPPSAYVSRGGANTINEIAYNEEYDQYLAEQRLARQAEQQAAQATADEARRARMKEGMAKAEAALATARAREEAAKQTQKKTKTQQAKEEAAVRKAEREAAKQAAAEAKAKATAEKAAAREAARQNKAEEAKARAAARQAAREEAAKARAKEAAKRRAEREAARKAKAEEGARPNQPAPTALTKVSAFWVSQAKRQAEKEAAARKERGVGTRKAGPEERERKAKRRVDSLVAFESNPPGEGELYVGPKQDDLFRRAGQQEPSVFVQTKEQAAALKARLTRIVQQAEQTMEMPGSIRAGQDDYVLFARVAKDAITHYVGKMDAESLQKTNDFVANEIAARAGDFEPMRRMRLEQGYQAKQRQASADEMIETASATSDAGRRLVAATTTPDIQTQLDEADEAVRFEMALERLREMLSVSDNLTREQILELAEIAGKDVADLAAFERALSGGRSNLASPRAGALNAPRIRGVETLRNALTKLFNAMSAPNEAAALEAARVRREARLAAAAETTPPVIELSSGVTFVSGEAAVGNSPVYAEPIKTLSLKDALSKAVSTSKYFAEAVPGQRAFSPIYKYLARLVTRLAGDTKIYVLTDADMDKIGFSDANGIFLRAPGAIYIRESVMDSPEDAAKVVLHEGVHAALTNRLVDDPLAIGQLEAIARYVVKHFNGTLDSAYGFANVQEFLAEALSNTSFQKWLMAAPLTPELAAALDLKAWRGRSLWWGLLNRFARWLGMGRFGEEEYTAMHGVMSVAERLGENRPPRFVPDWNRVFNVDYSPTADKYALSPYWAKEAADAESQANTSDTLASRKEELLSGVSDRAAATGSWLRRVAIVGSTLDQMRQQFAGLFVGKDGGDLLAKVVQAMQEQAPYAREKKKDADLLAQEFIRFTHKNATEAADLVDIMIDATMSNVRLGDKADNTHLDKSWRGIQGKNNLPRLQKAFAALSPEAKALYKKMADFYRATQNEMTRGVIGNVLDELSIKPKNREEFITRVMTGTMTPADETLLKDKPTALKAFKDANEMRVIQGDYFPLMRQGDYVVVTTDKIPDLMGGKELSPGKVEFRARTRAEAMKQANAFIAGTNLRVINRRMSPEDATTNDFGVIVTVQRNGVFFFERESDARKWLRENSGEYDEVSDVMPRRDTGMESKDLTVAQFNALMGAINRQEDAPENMKDAMRGIIEQAAARMMSGNRVQKQRIARRNVEGASKDFARNLLLYGQSTSGYLAKLRYAPTIRAALKEMTELSKNYMDKHASARVRILNELNKRINDNDVGANEPPRWMRDLMTVTYLSKLFSPMYSVVNGMQPWMVTYPVLAGRYGNVVSYKALEGAYKSIGFFGRAWDGLVNTGRSVKDFNDVAFDTRDIVGSIKKNLAKQEDGAELVQLIDELLARGAMSDAGFELSQAIAEGRGKVGTAFSHVDRVARQLPQAIEEINRAVAAVAAYRLAKSRPNVSAEKARAAAFDTVMNTQGDYSGGNAPRFFNNPILRPALQFKKYAQMMTYLLVDAVYRSFDGNISPEERSVARKQILNVLAVQVAMAGMLSLPGIEIAKLAFMVAAMFGFGDGWDDQEEKLRELANETFGKTWGELISRGVLSRALNVDLSKRLSLADMWTFGEPKKYDKENLGAYAFNIAFGAPGGTVMDIVDGFRKVGDGEWKTGLAQMLPIKVVADGLRAANGYSEGKVTNVELAMNIFGVRSGRQAEKSEEIGANIRKTQEIETAYKTLSRQYLRAQTAGERALLRAKIVEHNKAAPLRYKVFPNALDRRRAQNEAERVN